MKIKTILKNFEKKLNHTINEKNKNKPTFFQINWRTSSFELPIIDADSYWYFEDDGTIVFRVNDGMTMNSDIQSFKEFQGELEKFLKDYGDTEQGECEEEIENNFFFYTDDDGYGGSYWSVDDFAFIDDDNKVIIQINDWG